MFQTKYILVTLNLPQIIMNSGFRLVVLGWQASLPVTVENKLVACVSFVLGWYGCLPSQWWYN